MKSSRTSVVLCLWMIPLFVIAGCGPKQTNNQPRARTGNQNADGAGDADGMRPPPRPQDDIQVQGLMGTIDANAVDKAFTAKRRAVSACRRQHIGNLSYVGGDVQLFFKIGMDGVPTSVVLEKSQLGHHEMEACILGVAKGLKFVKPKGGVAEVRYTMTLANNGTDPKDWAAGKANKTLRKKRGALRACRTGRKPAKFEVTFYVLPGGTVKTVGVASSEALPAGFAACVAKVVTALTFEDPLGAVARATYAF
ncbi:MAG: AgmX/PglI C-terminal domain-containing protein [bacterium]